MNVLVDDEEIRDKYQLEVATKLGQIDPAVTLPVRSVRISQTGPDRRSHSNTADSAEESQRKGNLLW